jgi:MFS transporter, ACS family, hexuronate transporter
MISDFLFKGNGVVILLIITVLTAFSSVILAFIPDVTFWTIVPIVVIFGFCVSGFNGIWMNLASELVPREQEGISSGISITLGYFGAVFIPPIYGYTVDQTSSFTFGWLLITGLMVVVLSLLSYLAMVTMRKRYE